MFIGPAAKRPVELSISFGDRQVVDACDAAFHQTLFVKLPVLIPVGTEPVAAVVMAFVGEAHGDPVAGEGPKFLDQSIIKLLRPFSGQECFYFCTPVDKFGAVAPNAVACVGERSF